jgi:protein-disulfide isomerase
MNSTATKAAEASRCAAEQGKFWEMHILMMSQQESIRDVFLYAAKLNLDRDKFEDCLKTDKHKAQIYQAAALAHKLNIEGVPQFILASIDAQNPTKAKGIAILRGAQPFANFQKAIDRALASTPRQKPPQNTQP